MEEFISWAASLLGHSRILLLSHSSCQVTAHCLSLASRLGRGKSSPPCPALWGPPLLDEVP